MITSTSYLGHRGSMLCSVELTLYLSLDSAKLKLVWLCARCSLGWRVHPKMTALDVSVAKLQKDLQSRKRFVIFLQAMK